MKVYLQEIYGRRGYMKPQLSDLRIERGAPGNHKVWGMSWRARDSRKGTPQCCVWTSGITYRCSCMALTLKSIHEILRIGLQVRPPTNSQSGHWTVHTRNSFGCFCKSFKTKTFILNTNTISLIILRLLKFSFILGDVDRLSYFRKWSISCKLSNLCALFVVVP